MDSNGSPPITHASSLDRKRQSPSSALPPDGEAAPSRGDAPPPAGEAAPSGGNGLLAHGDAPTGRGNGAAAHGDARATNGHGAPHLIDGELDARPLPARQSGSFSYVRNSVRNALVLATGDALALVLGMFLAGTIRMWWFGEALIPAWSWLVLPFWCGGAILMHLLPGYGLGPVEELRRITILLFAVFASASVVLFLSKQGEEVSRLTLSLSLAFSLFAVPFTRIQVKRLLIRFGAWGVPTIIYGAGKAGSSILQLLQEEKELGYNPLGMLDDAYIYWANGRAKTDVHNISDPVLTNVPVAILAMPNVGRERLIELLEGALSQYPKVLIIPNLFEAPSLWVRPRDLSGVLGLEITSNLLNPIARFIKRSADLLAVVALTPLWLPLCGVITALIWLEDGRSPIFGQDRVGKDGRIFRTWKFRTMVPNAEEVLRIRLAEDERLREEWESFHKLRHDPRITRVGRILRRSSLDELPQLLNVLVGTMSIIGPRPLPLYHNDELPKRLRDLRERVRPGITGLWQVSGRSDIGTEGMEQLDAYYVRNWSLWLDNVVLIRTLRAVIRGHGAY